MKVRRLVEENHRGEIHDYDVSSIMAVLYSGWRGQEHTPEEEYAYNLAVLLTFNLVKNARRRVYSKERSPQSDNRKM